jgi:uncharacterized membrane protein
MSITPDKLVDRYLKHLDVELDDLPRDRRREIVDEIAGHIGEARAELEHETEADVRNILEGLGDPAEIASDAHERFDVRPAASTAPYKPGWMEVGALVLLLVGGLIVPIVGWLIGVILLWVSNAWNVRDKVIGTVFVPGGLLLPIFLWFSSLEFSSGGSVCDVDPATGREFNCREFGDASSTGLTDVLAFVLFVAVLVAPIVTTAYLTYRLRRNPAVATA